MTPPMIAFPNVRAFVDDFNFSVPSAMPGIWQATFKSPYARVTLTVPGVVTNHVPLVLVSEHDAPIIRVPPIEVWTFIDSIRPFTMEVQLAMNGIAKRATSALENCIWRLQKSESAIRVFL